MEIRWHEEYPDDLVKLHLRYNKHKYTQNQDVFRTGQEEDYQLFSQNAEMKSVCWCSG